MKCHSPQIRPHRAALLTSQDPEGNQDPVGSQDPVGNQDPEDPVGNQDPVGSYIPLSSPRMGIKRNTQVSNHRRRRRAEAVSLPGWWSAASCC